LSPARGAAAAALALALALPAAAQDVLPPEAFEAMSEGRTLHFSRLGLPFGAEQYFPGRRSLWRFADGTCLAGEWRPAGEAICFTYEGDPAEQCWHLRQWGGRFAAHLIEDGAEAGFRLDLERIASEPLPCPGPQVGS
jgi:hypothetical protein